MPEFMRAFMVGRAFSAYPWGKIADIYGRKFVLVVSLVASTVGSIAFGCSTTFAMAVAVRFAMGLGNGTMIVCRTSISELAKGDKDLESKGVGLLMSMVGYGMLISPSLGGLLSEPLRQYPDANIFNGRFDALLEKYPFLPPNLVSCLLSILALITVILSVEETLPVEKRRHWIHAGEDMAKYLVSTFQKLLSPCCGEQRTFAGEPSVSSTPVTSSQSQTEDDSDDSDWEEDLKILDSHEFVETAGLMATRDSRASYTSALHRSSVASAGGRPSSVQASDIEKAAASSTESTPLNPKAASDAKPPADRRGSTSMGGLLSNPDTRAYLVSYWINAFVSVSQSEAFPLFAMSHVGGLGLEEKMIGTVGTLSGLMFCAGQYFAFTQAMKLFGLVRALRLGAFWGNVPVVLMPISLLLSGWVQIIYMSFITGTLMICNSVYLGCNTIGSNRTVDSSQRAAMNGLSGLGTSIGRGLGPIAAGFLVAFSMTAGIIPPEFGGWFIYLVLGALGMIAYWATLWVPIEEEDDAT